MTIAINTVPEARAWAGRGCLPEDNAVCRCCGRPLCDHPDPVFAGVIPHKAAGQVEAGELVVLRIHGKIK